MALKSFTPRELKEFNGKAGAPAYVAFKGKVYDVSTSTLWADGGHRGRHFAGFDLTPVMMNAPHTEEVLSKFPVVGEIKEKLYPHKLQKRIERLHIHSIMVHFSVAFSFVIPLLILAYLITGNGSFEKTSYYLLLMLVAVSPLSGLSGFFSWKVTYEGRRSRTFDRKIILSVAVVVLAAGCAMWRFLSPDILVEKGGSGAIYAVLLVGTAVLTGILGRYGSKLVFA